MLYPRKLIVKFSKTAGEALKVQKDMSREELICELSQLHKRVAELEATQTQTQHKSVAALRKGANLQVRDILESITDAFISVDHDWRYVYVNQTALKLLGKTRRDELIGHVLWDVFPPPGVGSSPGLRRVPLHFSDEIPSTTADRIVCKVTSQQSR